MHASVVSCVWAVLYSVCVYHISDRCVITTQNAVLILPRKEFFQFVSFKHHRLSPCTQVYSRSLKDRTITCQNGLSRNLNSKHRRFSKYKFCINVKPTRTRAVFSVISLINQSTIISTNQASHHDCNLISADIHQPVDI